MNRKQEKLEWPDAVTADDGEVVSEPAAPSDEWGWTRRHQIGLAILLFCLLVFLAVQLWRHPVRLGSDVVIATPNGQVFPQRIDINTANWASLVRLPGIGPGRADRILAYRQAQQKKHPGKVVFRTLHDLQNVPGIGKKISVELLPYLRFPQISPAAAPATH